MRIELVLVALFVVATGVAMVARRLKVPYTVALVLAGLMLGTATDFEPLHLTKELVYAVFLPGLLFEAAFALEFKKFWANKLAISSPASPASSPPSPSPRCCWCPPPTGCTSWTPSRSPMASSSRR